MYKWGAPIFPALRQRPAAAAAPTAPATPPLLPAPPPTAPRHPSGPATLPRRRWRQLRGCAAPRRRCDVVTSPPSRAAPRPRRAAARAKAIADLPDSFAARCRGLRPAQRRAARPDLLSWRCTSGARRYFPLAARDRQRPPRQPRHQPRHLFLRRRPLPRGIPAALLRCSGAAGVPPPQAVALGAPCEPRLNPFRRW